MSVYVWYILTVYMLLIEICDITSHFQTLTPDDQFLMIMSDPQYYIDVHPELCITY